MPVRSGRIRLTAPRRTNLPPRRMLAAGICYVPQGRNIFPELSVRHNLELGGVALADGSPAGRAGVEAMMERFPMLREKAQRPGLARCPAASRSCSRSRAACCSTPG